MVPGIEKAEDGEAHGAGVLESLKPEGHLETVLAERGSSCSLGFPALPATRPRGSPSTRRGRRKTWQAVGASTATCSELTNHPEGVSGQLEAAEAKHRLLKRLPKLEDDKRMSGFDADRILREVTEYVDG